MCVCVNDLGSLWDPEKGGGLARGSLQPLKRHRPADVTKKVNRGH